MSTRNRCRQKEKLWWVRYIYKSDIAPGRRRETLPMGNAFFYAPTEEEARKKIASWQHFTRHNEVLVESLETAPHGFQFQWRPGLPATQTIDEQEQA